MDDEDDYDNYFPEIDLSAQVLAELDKVERNFVASQALPKPPPPKKQKIQHTSSEETEYDPVPIVLGFGGDYFAQGGAESNQRRDPPQPPVSQQTRQTLAITSKPAPVQANHTPVPAAQAQLVRQQQAQQSRALQAVRQPGGPAFNGQLQAATRTLTPQNTAYQKQNNWNNQSPNVNAEAGPSRPSPKPPPAVQSNSYTAQGQRLPAAQRQPPRQSPAPLAPHARNATTTPANPQYHAQPQTQRHPSVNGGQAQNQKPPEAQRLNPLKRQHSVNAQPTQSDKDPNATAALELEILRAQVAELQQRVKEAEEGRYVKEGEVSILRTSITKSAQEHMAEIAQLQAAREAAEAAKLQLVKEQKEEIERLRTQYTFRQHELETSVRKAPWSAQAKKIQTRHVGSPIRMPSQMRAWNSPRATQEPSSQEAQTPHRPRFGEIIASPEFTRSKPALRAPELKKPGPSLPGWQSGFEDSRPASQLAKDKGKSRLRESTIPEDEFFAPPSSPPSPSPLKRHRPLPNDVAMEDDAGPSEPAASIPVPPSQVAALPAQDEDVKMDDATIETQEEESHEIEPPNWRDEFQRLLFAHAMPGSNIPTLHLLFNSPVPASAPDDLQRAYTSSCARIMEHLGVAVRPVDWEAYMQMFSHYIADLACILASTAVLSQLAALFDLLRTLCYTIPSFTAALMAPPAADAPPRILTAVCDVIHTHMSAVKTAEHSDQRTALAHSTLSLLEALSWNIPEDVVAQLSIVIRGPDLIRIITARSQPLDVLTHSVRMLALLATHPTLFRHLLSPPDTADLQQSDNKDMTHQLSHIHNLCYCLVDSNLDGSEFNELKEVIVTFFSTLALTHPDALIILLKSRSLIPSIIIYLSNLATPIWEDDEELTTSPGRVTRVVGKILRAIALLYYLVFTPDPPFDLRHQLHRPPARHFMSIAHIFTVFISRIAYASLPSWLTEDQRSTLEQTVGMSKLLLELVVDGPELDAIWTAFHEDESSTGGDEDEENEARLLHPAVDTDE